MEITKIIIAFAIIMVLSISTVTMMLNTTKVQSGTKSIPTSYEDDYDDSPPVLRPSKRLSRFLVARNSINPRATGQCSRENDTMCNRNKCVDLMNDDDNCGKCNKKCNFTHKCCRGKCVYLADDETNCGECNHSCDAGDLCIYGFCNYA